MGNTTANPKMKKILQPHDCAQHVASSAGQHSDSHATMLRAAHHCTPSRDSGFILCSKRPAPPPLAARKTRCMLVTTVGRAASRHATHSFQESTTRMRRRTPPAPEVWREAARAGRDPVMKARADWQRQRRAHRGGAHARVWWRQTHHVPHKQECCDDKGKAHVEAQLRWVGSCTRIELVGARRHWQLPVWRSTRLPAALPLHLSAIHVHGEYDGHHEIVHLVRQRSNRASDLRLPAGRGAHAVLQTRTSLRKPYEMNMTQC